MQSTAATAGSPLLHADRALAARIEAATVRQSFACAGTLAAARPGRKVVALPVAGGVAAMMGRGGSLSQATGLGMAGPVEEADLVALEDVYRAAGMSAKVEVCPHAHASLLPRLAARGYRLTAMESALARPLVEGDEAAAAVDGVEVRAARLDEAALWVRVVDDGFREGAGDPDAEVLHTFEALAGVPGATSLLACIDGAPAGGAGVFCSEDVALLFGASTLPTRRRRGVQTALIRARLSLARRAGCTLAVVITAPGSGSQRNAEREGFRVVYSRAILVREQME